jgi:hypothetical protein
MFEIIWSNFNDAYVIRKISTNSTIKPNFIGSYDECKNKIKCFN